LRKVGGINEESKTTAKYYQNLEKSQFEKKNGNTITIIDITNDTHGN